MHSGEALLTLKIPFLKSIIIDAQMAFGKGDQERCVIWNNATIFSCVLFLSFKLKKQKWKKKSWKICKDHYKTVYHSTIYIFFEKNVKKKNITKLFLHNQHILWHKWNFFLSRAKRNIVNENYMKNNLAYKTFHKINM